MKALRSIIILLAKIVFVGSMTSCAYYLHPVSRPTDVMLRIEGPAPSEYIVRITAQEPTEYRVKADGKVEFNVPPFRRGCSVRLFEVIPIADQTPEHAPVIQVRRHQRLIRRLSLEQIERLPLDETGYRIVQIKK